LPINSARSTMAHTGAARLRRIPLFILLAVVAIGSQSQSRRDGPPSIQMRSHAPIKIRHSRAGSATRSNWSGYAASGTSGSVTEAEGSGTGPPIQGSCPSANQYSSFWVGIDGYTSKTVEQIGTDSDCQNGVPTYYGWYEFYPHWSYLIKGVTIKPYD